MNFGLKWSALYGENCFLFYFGVTVPYMLVNLLPILLYSLYALVMNNRNVDKNKDMDIKNRVLVNKLRFVFGLCFLYLLINSLSVHKEHRFILPILPFLLVLCLYPFTIHPSFMTRLFWAGFALNLLFYASFAVLGKNGGSHALSYLRTRIPPSPYSLS